MYYTLNTYIDVYVMKSSCVCDDHVYVMMSSYVCDDVIRCIHMYSMYMNTSYTLNDVFIYIECDVFKKYTVMYSYTLNTSHAYD